MGGVETNGRRENGERSIREKKIHSLTREGNEENTKIFIYTRGTRDVPKKLKPSERSRIRGTGKGKTTVLSMGRDVYRGGMGEGGVTTGPENKKETLLSHSEESEDTNGQQKKERS